jgi:hypothetical protein
MLAWKPSAPTPVPPPKTASRPSTCCLETADQLKHRGMVPFEAYLGATPTGPRALDTKTSNQWLRLVRRWLNPRDRVLALLPFYAGLRLGEAIAQDLADVQLSLRKGTVIVRSGKGNRYRESPPTPPCATTSRSGSTTNVPPGPAPRTTRRCCSTAAVDAFRPAPPIRSSDRSPKTPRSRSSPRTSCATPSAPDSSAKATTSSSSNSSDTPALIKPAATACPPKPTANEPSSACSPTTDQRRWPDYTYPVATR